MPRICDVYEYANWAAAVVDGSLTLSLEGGM